MYRVIKRFNDRYTGERIEVGHLYDSDEPGRIDHLIARGFLQDDSSPAPRRRLSRFMPTADSDEGDSP